MGFSYFAFVSFIRMGEWVVMELTMNALNKHNMVEEYSEI